MQNSGAVASGGAQMKDSWGVTCPPDSSGCLWWGHSGTLVSVCPCSVWSEEATGNSFRPAESLSAFVGISFEVILVCYSRVLLSSVSYSKDVTLAPKKLKSVFYNI